MKMFLDSAKTDEIRYALDLWDVDGVTTNPRHVKDSGKPFRTVIEEIAGLFAGTDKAVSVEVDPNLTDWEKIVEQGVELSKISPNFAIKVGCERAGIQGHARTDQPGRSCECHLDLLRIPSLAGSPGRGPLSSARSSAGKSSTGIRWHR